MILDLNPLREHRSRAVLRFVTAIAFLFILVGGKARADNTPPTPVIGAVYADRGVEPTRFSPNEINDLASSWYLNNYVRSIHWTSWGGPTAEGEGQVSLLDGNEFNYETPPTHQSPVHIQLTNLEECSGVPTYTSYSLTLAPGAAEPTRWPKGASGSLPCSGILGNFYRTARPKHRFRGCGQGIVEPRRNPREEDKPNLVQVRWDRALPGPGDPFFCGLAYTAWEGSRRRANGLMENLYFDHAKERNWPAVVEWSKPAWCSSGAEGKTPITFTEFRVTIYGPPRKPTKKTLSSYGHKGLPVTHRSRQSFTPGPLCSSGYSGVNPLPAR